MILSMLLASVGRKRAGFVVSFVDNPIRVSQWVFGIPFRLP